MAKENISNDIITLFKRSNTIFDEDEDIKEEEEQNVPKIIYDEGFKTDDIIVNSIITQFLNSKKHIDAVKKIDTGTYSKEYFLENLPHYNPKLHEVLEKCSKKKTHDDNAGLKINKGNFTLDFS